MRNSPEWETEMRNLAEDLTAYGRKQGADEIEVAVADGIEYSLDVRMGRIENLIQAGSRHLSLRLLRESRTASASTSDLAPDTLRRLVDNALERAVLTHRDEFAGLPENPGDRIDPAGLDLYDPEIDRLSPESRIELALKTESLALADPRITNSHGASFETREILSILVNSRGFSGAFRETFFHLSLGLQAGGTDDLVEGAWSSSRRKFDELDTPETVAGKAVERTVRHLNPRKLATQTVPVMFESEMTAWLLGFLFSCVSGTAVYNRATFLADRLGARIGGDRVTVIDDGRLPGRLGTAPFDAEGVSTRRTPVVEGGILRNFLCNTYAARKLGLASTGNASGGGVGPTNFHLIPGGHTPEDMLRSMEKGLILTRVLGHGLNPVSGDFSRGAFGLWVEGGEVIHPVSEITISGNLGRLLRDIEMIGDDLNFSGPICGPSLKVGELQIAGL